MRTLETSSIVLAVVVFAAGLGIGRDTFAANPKACSIAGAGGITIAHGADGCYKNLKVHCIDGKVTYVLDAAGNKTGCK